LIYFLKEQVATTITFRYNSKNTPVATTNIHWLQLIKKHFRCNHEKNLVATRQESQVIATFDIFLKDKLQLR
jgi:hypothetical protein